MSETPVTQDKEAFEAFKKNYNLDPANNLAVMNCLFEQSEKIERMELKYAIQSSGITCSRRLLKRRMEITMMSFRHSYEMRLSGHDKLLPSINQRITTD